MKTLSKCLQLALSGLVISSGCTAGKGSPTRKQEASGLAQSAAGPRTPTSLYPLIVCWTSQKLGSAASECAQETG